MADNVVYVTVDAETIKEITTVTSEKIYKLPDLLRKEAEILDAIDRTNLQHVSDIEKKQAELLEIRNIKTNIGK